MLKFFILPLIALSLNAAPAEKQSPKESPQIVVEPDQTDIFAIPLDEDAQDQQEELEALEHPHRSGL